MTDLLKDAEQRGSAYLTATQAEQAATVASVRQEIGPQHYEAAKQQLPIMEKAIREDFLPWVSRITRIAQETGDYPAAIRSAVEAIATSCEAGPRQLLAGIALHDRLEFTRDLAWKDGRQVDVNRRADYIGRTRRGLRSWDGLLSAMKSQQGQAETYIRQAEWPRRAGVSATTVVGIVEPERGEGIQVETGFEVRR